MPVARVTGRVLKRAIGGRGVGTCAAQSNAVARRTRKVAFERRPPAHQQGGVFTGRTNNGVMVRHAAIQEVLLEEEVNKLGEKQSEWRSLLKRDAKPAQSVAGAVTAILTRKTIPHKINTPFTLDSRKLATLLGSVFALAYTEEGAIGSHRAK